MTWFVSDTGRVSCTKNQLFQELQCGRLEKLLTGFSMVAHCVRLTTSYARLQMEIGLDMTDQLSARTEMWRLTEQTAYASAAVTKHDY